MKFSTRICITAVGKMKDQFLKSSFDEYRRRAERYFGVEIVELKRRSYGKADRVEGELENERRKLESKKKERSFLIVLDEKGKELTTGELAAMISDLQKRRYTEIRFFIGGPYGMAPGARAGSDLLLSMSRLTLPHQLARVMLMEQIYRCGTILSGENYHK